MRAHGGTVEELEHTPEMPSAKAESSSSALTNLETDV
jgi:hypothetical protein